MAVGLVAQIHIHLILYICWVFLCKASGPNSYISISISVGCLGLRLVAPIHIHLMLVHLWGARRKASSLNKAGGRNSYTSNASLWGVQT